MQKMCARQLLFLSVIHLACLVSAGLSQYKINAYGALLDVYVKWFGQSEGEKLAAADSGPIDEAYVGGGS